MSSVAAQELELRRRVAENVRAYRKAKRLTVKQAAARAEMHWRLWQKIEASQSNATMFTMVRLANALDLTPADLLREPPPEVPTKK